MTNNPTAEILTASEITVKAANKELGRTFDYSLESLKDLEALLQHVKSNFYASLGEGLPSLLGHEPRSARDSRPCWGMTAGLNWSQG